MTDFTPRRGWPLIALFAASGCAAPTANPRFPSLLPRTIETRSDAEPETRPVVVAPDPATDARVTAWRKVLDQNTAAFATAATGAARAAGAARGDVAGGERWITAQAALADLDALRATTSSTLTEIDSLSIARASKGLPPYPALDALRGEAQAATEAQGERIATLQAALPGA